MKGLLGKIRLSRKIVFILAGVLLFLGAVGGAVLYFFADRVTGTQEAKAEEANGLVCNDLRSEILRKKNRYWIRQYVSVDGGDGMTRLKTAMRVALGALTGLALITSGLFIPRPKFVSLLLSS